MDNAILVIEDDLDLASILKKRLEMRGFQVITSYNGKEGLTAALEYQPCLVILDIMMPELNGLETCKSLRQFTDIPIILLTAMASEEYVIRGFQAGADDYVRKPFSFGELEERIDALLKRATPRLNQPITYYDSNLKIDVANQEVFLKGESVHLTPTEFKLLSALVQNQGRVISHKELLSKVWGPNYQDATGALSLYIRYLREKLEEDPKNPHYIRSKWGSGYSFNGKIEREILRKL